MSISGVNIDPRNPVGDPSAAKLAGFEYVRFPYDVAVGTGSLDYDAAHVFYSRRFDALRAAGITSIVIFTHRLYGEGRGYNWNAMTAADWNKYIGELVEAIRRTAARYTGRGHVYQIWNEGDAASEAAIYMPPTYYGALFRLAYDAIKTVDPSARVIIGGLVSGPGEGIKYYNAANIAKHDGIGIHTYGAGAGGLYNIFGTIDAQLTEWRKLGRPLWITEFGVLNAPNDPVERVAAYAAAFMKACAGKVEAACWYGWGQGMHNGYGIENRGVVRQSLFEALMTTPAPVPTNTPYKRGQYVLTGGSVRIRKAADADSETVVILPIGAPVEVTGEPIEHADGWGWQAVASGGQSGFMALHGAKVTWSLVPVPVIEPPIVDAAFRAEMRAFFEQIKAMAEAGLARLDEYEAEALAK